MYSKYHLKEHKIPKGYQIYIDRLKVADILNHIDDAITFIKSESVYLELEREDNNQDDPNSIKILGCYKGIFRTKRHHIGYVPKKFGKIIIETGYWDKIKPRLLKTSIGKTEYVEILFQILGPRGEKKYFHSK